MLFRSQSYQGAMNKLATGRGNVIRQAESFKQLGVEVKRPISASITELSQGQDVTGNEDSAKNAPQLERHPTEDKVN